MAGAVAGAVLVVATAACSSETVEGTASAQDTTSMTATTTTTAARSGEIAGQAGEDDGGSTDIDVEIGDCVKLGGTTEAAEIESAVCGSDDSNYKVIAKASKNAQCPSDVDQVYYETLMSIEQGALCLDIDWVVGGCMSLPDGEDEPFRVDCDDPIGGTVEKATSIIEGTTDVDECDEGGFTHPERQFTVCTETITG